MLKKEFTWQVNKKRNRPMGLTSAVRKAFEIIISDAIMDRFIWNDLLNLAIQFIFVTDRLEMPHFISYLFVVNMILQSWNFYANYAKRFDVFCREKRLCQY